MERSNVKGKYIALTDYIKKKQEKGKIITVSFLISLKIYTQCRIK